MQVAMAAARDGLWMRLGHGATVVGCRPVGTGEVTERRCDAPTRRGGVDGRPASRRGHMVPSMREAAPGNHEPLEVAAFAACLATILELPIEEIPAPEAGVDAPEGWRRWLGGRGLGLVPISGAGEFAWPGPWIARVRPATGEPPRAVVMFGVPSGVAWDPTGTAERKGWTIADGFVIAALDVALALPPGPPPVIETGVVEAICLARRAEASVSEVDSARALPGRGLEGDRHVEGLGTFPSDVSGSALTLIDAEVLDSFADGQSPRLTADEHRRNVVTRGIDVNALVGRDFTIGEVRCRGMRLCEPCSHLQRLTTRSVLRELVHRGGLRADILTEGQIRVGDAVRSLR